MIDKDAIARDILDLEDKGKVLSCTDKTYIIMLHIQDYLTDVQHNLFDEVVEDLRDRDIL